MMTVIAVSSVLMSYSPELIFGLHLETLYHHEVYMNYFVVVSVFKFKIKAFILQILNIPHSTPMDQAAHSYKGEQLGALAHTPDVQLLILNRVRHRTAWLSIYLSVKTYKKIY